MQTKLIPRKGVERLLVALVFLGINLLFSSCKDTPTQLKIRAETGELQAIVRLADAYQQGVYEDQPMPYWPEEAVRLFRQAAEQGDPKGMRRLGWCLLEGNGTRADWWEGASWLIRGYRESHRDRKKSLNQLQAEALSGLAKSQYRLAFIYRDGQGVDPDPARALELFGQAARQGYADSRHQLAKLKIEWARFQETKTRAKQGDVAAMIRYADYLEGSVFAPLKIRPDNVSALQVLETSSRKSAEGKMALARYLLRNDPFSEEQARKLIRAASQVGYQPAMEFIAGLQGQAQVSSGADLFPSQESFQVCQQLAKAGVRSAQVLLAKKYLDGNGIARDPAKAVPWLRRAATPPEKDSGLVGIFFDGLFGPDRGDAEAQYLLGYSYREGLGVAKSPAEAIRWFLAASENGYGEAKTALAALRMAEK